MALTDKLSNIGNAIRAKTGKTDKLTLDQMPAEILSIVTGEGGGNGGDYNIVSVANDDGTQTLVITDAEGGTTAVLIEKTITANGTYNAANDGADGYSRVIVNVSSSGGGDDIDALINRSITSVVIPNDVTVISKYLFAGCTQLTDVYIPDGVTSIGMGAFEDCGSLELTSLPPNITSIESYAFDGCGNISLTSLPAGITLIGYRAFANCDSLTSISIPAGVTEIELSAFGFCEGLTSVTFEGTPTKINGSAFNYCNNLTDIYVPWAEGAVANAPWGATNATIHYNN